MRWTLRVEELAIKSLLYLSVLLVFGSLFAIFAHVFYNGITHVNLEFIFSYPQDMGRTGGIFPAIVGSIYLVVLALAVATPIGILALFT